MSNYRRGMVKVSPSSKQVYLAFLHKQKNFSSCTESPRNDRKFGKANIVEILWIFYIFQLVLGLVRQFGAFTAVTVTTFRDHSWTSLWLFFARFVVDTSVSDLDLLALMNPEPILSANPDPALTN